MHASSPSTDRPATLSALVGVEWGVDRVAETTPKVPDRPSPDGLDVTWSAVWERDGTYRFHVPGDRAAVFSIDTPPPTVSGSLHVGHVFSYTHTDMPGSRFRNARSSA